MLFLVWKRGAIPTSPHPEIAIKHIVSDANMFTTVLYLFLINV